jgi:cytochrome c
MRVPSVIARIAWLLLLTGCAAGDDEATRLLAQYQCASCHAIPGVPGGRGGIGPPLAQFGLRSYIAGQWPNDAATLARWIAEPQALVPGTAMPDMGVSDADARVIAAYLLRSRR